MDPDLRHHMSILTFKNPLLLYLKSVWDRESEALEHSLHR